MLSLAEYKEVVVKTLQTKAQEKHGGTSPANLRDLAAPTPHIPRPAQPCSTGQEKYLPHVLIRQSWELDSVPAVVPSFSYSHPDLLWLVSKVNS